MMNDIVRACHFIIQILPVSREVLGQSDMVFTIYVLKCPILGTRPTTLSRPDGGKLEAGVTGDR
jgi:hypothetical protein